MTGLLMGGRGAAASPGPADVLQCDPAGLGWPPNVQTPCAGSPRRFLRGACAGAPNDRTRNACSKFFCQHTHQGGSRPSDRSARVPYCHTSAARPCTCWSDSRYGLSCRDRATPCFKRSSGPRAQRLGQFCAGRITSRADGRRNAYAGGANANWGVGEQPSQATSSQTSHPKRGNDLPYALVGLPAHVSEDSRRDIERSGLPVCRGFQFADGYEASSYNHTEERCSCPSPKVAPTNCGQLAEEDRDVQAGRGHRCAVSKYPADTWQPTDVSWHGWPLRLWKKLPSERAISSIDRTTAYRPDFFYRKKPAKIAGTFLQTTRFAAPKSLMPDGATEWQTRKDMAAWMT